MNDRHEQDLEWAIYSNRTRSAPWIAGAIVAVMWVAAFFFIMSMRP